MTSEVVLMNSDAIALAADSATTVTYWEDGKELKRYFKGANKIFQLSSNEPVGLMTYSSADLQGVPWGLLVKLFREHSSYSSHPTLKGYSESFFDFLTEQNQCFTEEYQESLIIDRMLQASIFALNKVVTDEVVKNASETERDVLIKSTLSELKKEIDGSEYFSNLDLDLLDDLRGKLRSFAVGVLTNSPLISDVSNMIDYNELYDLSFNSVFKKGSNFLNYTGLVFTGFGDEEVFASMHHYVVYGIFGGQLIYEEIEDSYRAISPSNTSEIVPIAQSDMLSTFMYGASSDTMSEIEKVFYVSLSRFANSFCKKHNIEDDDLDEEKDKALAEFVRNTYYHLIDNHSDPLRRVVSMLPIDELAELGETLISLESLKERVTKPSESVSGPIDVAVISKGDGFIWIKRKHYFDANLNPRYMQNKIS